MPTSLRSAIRWIVLFSVVASSTQVALAQLIRAPLDSGFVRGSSIAVTVDEMYGPQRARAVGEPILGPGYPALWIGEVQFKPVRHVLMNVTDPRTGQVNEELVWYLIWRVIPRDYTELAGESRNELLKKLNDQDLLPQNTVDKVSGYPLQLPRFVLRTDDSADRTEYVDEVNLEIQRAIFAREFRDRDADRQLLSSVGATQEVIDPVSADDPDQLDKAVYGVAIWRNVDPTIDYFTIIMTGFSNAYRISRDDAGELVVEEKSIEQRFGRPGDQFRQEESEFRLIDSARLDAKGNIVVAMDGTVSEFAPGNPGPAFVDELRDELEKDAAAGIRPEQTWPVWKYRKRDAQITVPQFETILRNSRAAEADAAAVAN